VSGYTGNRRLSHEMALPPVIPSLTDKQPRNSPVSADRIPPERRGLLGAKKREKGGEGVFFAGIASYVVDGIDVGRWLPVCFCALLRHFSRCFGEGRAARAKARTGLAFVVSHPCLKNRVTARMGHPAVATIFRKFSCMVVPSGRLLLLCAFGS